jgi:hypothetical protein
MRRLIERIRNLPNPAKAALNHIGQLPEPSPRAYRDQMFLGHYVLVCTLAYCADIIFEDIAGWPSFWLVHVISDAAFCLFLVAFWSEIRTHSRKLCERCARSTPLDPQAAVARWRPALRWLHRYRAQKIFVVLLLAVMTTNALWQEDGYRDYADMTVVFIFLVYVTMQHKHKRLQPWCPWCNWGKGGDKEVSPEVPDPALSK